MEEDFSVFSIMNLNDVEQRCREVEEKCLAVELQIRKKHMELEEIKVRVRVLEIEKLAIEEEIEVLKRKKAALEGTKVDEMIRGEFSFDEWKIESDEMSKADQLMVENKVLECEKSIALREVESWKQKCKELEVRVVELEAKSSISIGTSGDSRGLRSPSCSTVAREGKIGVEGTPFMRTPEIRYVLVEDSQNARTHNRIRVKKQLAFRNERRYDWKIAPCTPAGARPTSGVVIDIADSDDELDVTDDIMDQEKENAPLITTPKRKWYPKVVTSDDECEDDEVVTKKRAFRIDNSEDELEDDNHIMPEKQVFDMDDDDDNIPISQLKMNRGQQAGNLTDNLTRPRRRLVKSEQVKQKDNETEEDESESDDSSLSNFIVDDSGVDDVEDDLSEEADNNDSSGSDSNLEFDEIISKLKRGKKNPNSRWDLEGDMLSAFGKDPELCMRAVCVLYRQQTTMEKMCKESIIQNGRGFSKFDASRGTNLGEFLTGGDANGDLVKSVKELREHDPNGLELCCKLAKHYSKQLFDIYTNNEDEFFTSS